MVASFLPGFCAAREPFRADLDHEIQTGDVVRPSGVESDLDIARLKRPVVGLFGTLDRERNSMRKCLREPVQVLLCNVRAVSDVDEWHDYNVAVAPPPAVTASVAVSLNAADIR